MDKYTDISCFKKCTQRKWSIVELEKLWLMMMIKKFFLNAH